MIVIKLSGGLGNQMFQYAFGKHLAVKNNTDLKLDLSFYNSQNLRNYELQKFYIKERIATKSDISSFVLPENPSISNKINYNFQFRFILYFDYFAWCTFSNFFKSDVINPHFF